MTTKVKIAGNTIVIKTFRAVSERFGIGFVSRNNYGEPKNVSKMFKTAQESLDNEVKELKSLFN